MHEMRILSVFTYNHNYCRWQHGAYAVVANEHASTYSVHCCCCFYQESFWLLLASFSLHSSRLRPITKYVAWQLFLNCSDTNFKGKKEGKVVTLHAMEKLGGRGDIAPTFS
jgi:hypothetical protein